MLAEWWCKMFGHKRRTVHNLYGIVVGQRIVENHKRCPRCGIPLEPL